MSAATKTRAAKSVVMLQRPVGEPSAKLGADFGLKDTAVPVDIPDEGVLVEIKYVSVDPYLRGRMRDPAMKLNDPINGYVSGKVVESKNPKWRAGDLFGANLPFTTVQVLQADQMKTFIKLTDHISEDDLSIGIGLLGMPGSTAYAGLDLMNVGENDRVWISAATGAVGALAGQIAKNVRKAKLVIGSAGSDEKCAIAKQEFGYDACLNYKHAKDAKELAELVKKNSPEGIDFYFENVGGDHFTAAMGTLRTKGRIAVCGAIQHYNTTEQKLPTEQISLGQIIYQQQRIEGFLCGDWLYGKRGNFLADMSKWYKEGLIHKKETVYDGLEKWPEAFASLFAKGGDNLGKVVVKV